MKRALDYPYAIPEHSFALVGERAVAVEEVEVDLGERLPLLAYGSNASPEALARKLADSADPLPLFRATLRDFDVVYSAHVSPYGSVPANLRASAGTEVRVFVAHPTAEQLEQLAATEPNYDLTPLEASCECEEAEAPARLSAFLSRHGCLRLDGSEIALAAVRARGRRLPAMGQRELLERLRDELDPGRDLERFVLDRPPGPLERDGA